MQFVQNDVQDFFIKLTRNAIRLRKSLVNGADRMDYLNYLLELQQRKNLSEIDMVAHTITFFVDGYETSGSVIALNLYCIAAHIDVQHKLRREINEVMSVYGDAGNDSVKYEHLMEMEYLDQVFLGKRYNKYFMYHYMFVGVIT